MQSEPLLEIKGLSVSFETDEGSVQALDAVDFEMGHGQTLGLVGESGCGKSVTALSIMRLLPKPIGCVTAGSILFQGEDLLKLSPDGIRKIRGNEIGMIFQEPMNALNPVMTIGDQLSEVFLLHQEILAKEAWGKSIEMLKSVGIPAPESRVFEYPHQLSGGMRQRVVIAMALACKPKLVIADEPTTALDVTVQAQILELLQVLQRQQGSSILLITHDLGVIAESCDEVCVMYAGRVVERASTNELFASPRHAYTRGLLSSIPRLDRTPKTELSTIDGMVPSLSDLNQGCRFAPRSGKVHPQHLLDERSPFVEIAQGHWVEECSVCTNL
ncbi:MAG: ABC transporter ATP-binding protein [Opitutae bacterium]|jgi:oligopeptide/dipeptide ABC transporter ATP-binding protein|tara:strand:- start:295 stop:1281 length:987 start_codon:yes stop_codon:yes gene_type:complete